MSYFSVTNIVVLFVNNYPLITCMFLVEIFIQGWNTGSGERRRWKKGNNYTDLKTTNDIEGSPRGTD